MDFRGVKNLIFDLGDVIINIDPQITFKAFSDRLAIPVSQFEKIMHSDFWHLYETGKISEDKLLANLYSFLNFNGEEISKSEFKVLWNSLLLDIPQARLELLKKLASKYRLFVLSNTNQIHVDGIAHILESINKSAPLDSYFEKLYYSHKIGLRKPDPDIYKYVLKDKNLLPFETVFIDDNEQNIISAQSLGIKTIHVIAPNTILELLATA